MKRKAPFKTGSTTASVRFAAIHAARVIPLPGGRLRAEFTGELPAAVAPGQAVVLYDGDRVVGGGLIDCGKRAVAVA